MPNKLRILFAEDLDTDYEIERRELVKAGLAFDDLRVETEDGFKSALAEFKPDIVVSDYSMPQFNGRQALDITLKHDIEIPFVMCTGSMNETTAVECMKAGAWDYVLKRHVSQLPFAVKEALARKKERSEKEHALELIRENEHNYRTLADSGQAMIWTSGTDMKCEWFNSVWLKFTGRKMEQETGDGWAENVHPDDLKGCLATYMQAFAKREPFSMSYRLKRHDGEYRWLIDTGSPRFELSGAFIGYIGHCLDITERVLAEEFLKKALAEREVLLRELYHRVNNSLQVIISLLDMQASRTGDEVMYSHFMDTENRIVSMALVHQQLYKYNDLSCIDLAEYLSVLAAKLFENLNVIPGSIALEFNVLSFMALVDFVMPVGMLFNELLTNSIKHAFPGGRSGKITVGIGKTENGKVEFVYSDDGIGVPADFDFRGQTSIGLTSVFGIAEYQLGGTVEIKNEKGLAWRFELMDNLYERRV